MADVAMANRLFAYIYGVMNVDSYDDDDLCLLPLTEIGEIFLQQEYGSSEPLWFTADAIDCIIVNMNRCQIEFVKYCTQHAEVNK